MPTIKSIAATMALFSVMTTALANDLNGVNLQQKGVSLSINGSASLMVPNDQAHMVWTSLAQAPTLKEATQKVISTMNHGQSLLKSMGSQWDLKTSGFNSYPVYSETKGNQASKIIAWRVSQNLSIRLHDVSDAPRVIEKLSGQLELDQLTFSVSDKARTAYEQKLIQMAINDATKRAVVVAESLGRNAKKVEIQNIRFQGVSAPRPEYGVMRSSLKVASDANTLPMIESGNSTLNMTVTTDVLIKR